MARGPCLPSGIRLSEHISLGVIAMAFPLGQAQEITSPALIPAECPA